ncbi:hypothetical protein [Roseibium sp.]|uniref:hypothetical protein n=2 Tax=Roseibium sp. TaxID=1936156 RepID=UPI0032655DF4
MGDRSVAIKLWFINVLTITATVSIYVWCSYSVMQQYGSVFLASAIFSLQWIGPIFGFGYINRLFKLYAARKIVGFALCVIIGFQAVLLLDMNVYGPFFLAVVVGTAESVIKIARLIIIKRFVRPRLIGQVNSFSATGQFIGGALGGVVFATTFAGFSGVLLPLCTLVFLFASLLVTASLPREDLKTSIPPSSSTASQLRSVWSHVTTNIPLARALVGLLGVCALVQGFHNVARVGLPVDQWSGDESVVGLLQSLVAAVTIAGALFYMLIDRKLEVTRFVLPASTVVFLALIGVSQTWEPLSGFVVYAILIFVFEYVFLFFQASVVQAADHDRSAEVFAFQFLMINIGMFSAGLLGGAIAETFGYPATAVIFATGFIASMMYARPRRSMQPSTMPPN